MPRNKSGPCQLCGRHCQLTFHHLIPQQVHRRKHFRKHYSREQLQQGIDLCRLCHKGLHRLYDEMTLAQRLNTLHALQKDSKVIRHVAWVAKQRVTDTQRDNG